LRRVFQCKCTKIKHALLINF